MTTYHPREMTSVIRAALSDTPVVVLTGMRQSGKSTLLQRDESFGTREYVTFDDLAQLESARRDPAAFLDRANNLTIDEAQRFPQLLLYIKRSVDQKRRPGRYLLSGSANFALLRGISESLAGRSLYLDLLPFTRRERLKQTRARPFLRSFFDDPTVSSGDVPVESIHPLELLDGGMPQVALHLANDRANWFKGYVQTYLERDLRDLTQVGDLIGFRTLIGLAAHRTGQVLNLSELARDAQMPPSTVTRHLGLLETSCIVRRLHAFHRNPTKRLMKAPKLHLSDSGLAAHLTNLVRPEDLASSPLRGPLLETYVAQNLASLVEAHWSHAELCYWHIQGRYEVDFVIAAEGKSLAIEVKAAGRWTERDVRGLEAFVSTTPDCVAGILAYNGTQVYPIGKKLWAIPLGLLLS